MELMSLLKEKQLSVYQCAKESHVPSDILGILSEQKSRLIAQSMAVGNKEQKKGDGQNENQFCGNRDK